MSTDPPGSDRAPLEARIAELEELLERHRQVATVLSESERLFRSLLENAPDSITVLDLDGRILYVNRTFAPRRVEDVIGKRAWDFLHPAHQEAFKRELELAVSTGAARSIEVESMGSLVWETRLVPLKRDGRVVEVMGIGADVTERRWAERALRESEEKLRLTVEAARVGLWTWDTGARSLSLDGAAAAMIGVVPGLAPKTYEEVMRVVHSDDHARVLETARRFVETGIFDDFECRVIGAQGESRFVLCRGKAIAAAPGMPVTIIGGVVDITERKRLEEQLRQAQKLEAVGQLTAGIAHNFNNLLTAIIPTVQLARRDAPPFVSERLLDAEYAALRAAELVRQLVVFAGHHRTLPHAPVDVRSLLQRIASICRATFDRSIDLSLMDNGADATVRGDAGQLEQVFLNVCLNARDAVETGSERRIRMTLDSIGGGPGSRSEVRVRICDTGPGMTDDVRSRVFEPFFTTKETGRGSGLGLATAYAIVLDHGGRLVCESEPGRGATFTIALPSTDESRATTQSPLSPSLGGKETVLVVDDERLVRNAVRGILEPMGYTVVEAPDGASGLELFKKDPGRFEVVLLDLSMPGMSGDQVLEEMLGISPSARVVLFSGYGQSVRKGAAAFLEKPVEVEGLLSVIRDVCDR